MDESLQASAFIQMRQDFSPLFNKDTICNFNFELSHRFEWWLKVKKTNTKWMVICLGIFLLIGIIVCLLQLWYNKQYPSQANSFSFVFAGVLTLFIGFFLVFIYKVFLWWWFNKVGHDYYDIFSLGMKEGYLCDDWAKYPPVIRITYYLNDAVSRPDGVDVGAQYRYLSPVFALSALLTQIKDYQAKYCKVPTQDNNQNNACL